jgi:hypothetical protein
VPFGFNLSADTMAALPTMPALTALAVTES